MMLAGAFLTQMKFWYIWRYIWRRFSYNYDDYNVIDWNMLPIQCHWSLFMNMNTHARILLCPSVSHFPRSCFTGQKKLRQPITCILGRGTLFIRGLCHYQIGQFGCSIDFIIPLKWSWMHAIVPGVYSLFVFPCPVLWYSFLVCFRFVLVCLEHMPTVQSNCFINMEWICISRLMSTATSACGPSIITR